MAAIKDNQKKTSMKEVIARFFRKSEKHLLNPDEHTEYLGVGGPAECFFTEGEVVES